jgi:hypothetical protein
VQERAIKLTLFFIPVFTTSKTYNITRHRLWAGLRNQIRQKACWFKKPPFWFKGADYREWERLDRLQPAFGGDYFPVA